MAKKHKKTLKKHKHVHHKAVTGRVRTPLNHIKTLI